MPPLPPAGNICRCVYSGTYGGAKWANVFFVRYAPGPAAQADLNGLATGLRTAWNTNIKPLMVAAAQLTQTTCTDLVSNTGLTGVDNTAVVGTNVTTAPMPANVALVVSFKIARRYRGGHPRMYLTGQATGNTASNTNWTGTYAATVATNMEAWRVAVNALTFPSMSVIQLVNLSYYTGHILRPVPTFDTINAVSVHTRVDTQRRRVGKEIA